jgi:chromosome segregation ATPase
VNKDKTIKDLKERNDKLKNQYDLLEMRNYNLNNKVERQKEIIKQLDIKNLELTTIIKEVREWAKKYSCQFTNDDGELVVSEISFNIQARPCDLFKILDKENI